MKSWISAICLFKLHRSCQTIRFRQDPGCDTERQPLNLQICLQRFDWLVCFYNQREKSSLSRTLEPQCLCSSNNSDLQSGARVMGLLHPISQSTPCFSSVCICIYFSASSFFCNSYKDHLLQCWSR